MINASRPRLLRLSGTLMVTLFLIAAAGFSRCGRADVKEINIGYIGPMSERATDLGIGPAKALQLAVEEYNAERLSSEPEIKLHVADDQWKKELALPQYEKLRKEHNIDILFISNSDGTVAVQEAIERDHVIVVNPLNSDALLSSLNANTFKIAKSTEEANALVGLRIAELDLRNVVVFYYPNDFMTRAANAVKEKLDAAEIQCNLVQAEVGQTDFKSQLLQHHQAGCEAYVFFGYKEFGFAMKQGRDMGIQAPYFGSTVLLDPAYYDNSEGTIVGTECTFFTPLDGNYVLAHEFLEAYKARFGSTPFSVWPPMQAYDAINLCINELRHVNTEKPRGMHLGDWLRDRLYRVRYFQGVCGNISITEDGSSRGIYFSLYRYASKGQLVKVRR